MKLLNEFHGKNATIDKNTKLYTQTYETTGHRKRNKQCKLERGK